MTFNGLSSRCDALANQVFTTLWNTSFSKTGKSRMVLGLLNTKSGEQRTTPDRASSNSLVLSFVRGHYGNEGIDLIAKVLDLFSCFLSHTSNINSPVMTLNFVSL